MTGRDDLIPAMEGTLDVCLTNQTIFDGKAFVFYALVPSRAHAREDGTNDYRVLGFSIPSIGLVKQAPAGDHLQGPPHLELRSGTVAVLGPSEWTPTTSADLSTFFSDGKSPANRILEISGDRVLLQLLTGDGLTIAVADKAAKTLVRLSGSLATTIENAHLTPGGTHVLVEEVTAPNPKVSKTGTVQLYDGMTGALAKTFFDAHVQKLQFRGISPTGKVLYDLLDSYWFLDLGVTFPTNSVTRPYEQDFPPPAFFFSDR
jgi:hypothetical protein